jgi:hypothetical protein
MAHLIADWRDRNETGPFDEGILFDEDASRPDGLIPTTTSGGPSGRVVVTLVGRSAT